MDAFDYKTIMKYFPPVNNSIEDLFNEANHSYNNYKSSSPLKIPDKNLSYSLDIMNNLRTLRILLNSTLTHERFMFELNKLYESWGPNGRNILNIYYLNMYSKIKHKEQKRYELMKEATTIGENLELGDLENKLSNLSFNKYKIYNINDLDIDKLNIKTIKKSKKKKYFLKIK